MSSKKSIGIATSPWPRFCCNPGATGRSDFPGPKGSEISWQIELEITDNEPAIGPDGTIHVPLKSDELTAISSKGEEIFRSGIEGRIEKSRGGITTPAIRGDGSIIAPALAVVRCLEPDGSTRWVHFIDGRPSAPNIGPDGTIYVPGWSIDWIGMYVISPDGNPTGKDDPRVAKTFTNHRSIYISPPAIDDKGNVYVASRVNDTHPEAYTWDPPDEVDEDFYEECIIFDSKGNKLARVTRGGTKSRDIMACVDGDGILHYTGGWETELVGLNTKEFLSWTGNEKKKSSHVKTRQVYNNMNKFEYGWENYHDKQGEEGPIYSRKVMGWPAVSGDSKLCFRLTRKMQWGGGRQPKFGPSDVAVILDTKKTVEMPYTLHESLGKKNSKKKATRNILAHEVLALQGISETNPVIDSNQHIYIGTANGEIQVFDIVGTQLRTIDVGVPVSTIVIGKDESLVFTSEKQGILGLIH